MRQELNRTDHLFVSIGRVLRHQFDRPSRVYGRVRASVPVSMPTASVTETGPSHHSTQTAYGGWVNSNDASRDYLGTDHDFLSATASFILLISAFRRTSRIAFPIAARIFCSCVEFIRGTFRRVLVAFAIFSPDERQFSCLPQTKSIPGLPAKNCRTRANDRPRLSTGRPSLQDCDKNGAR